MLANPHQIKPLEAYQGIGGSDPIDRAVELAIESSILDNLIDHDHIERIMQCKKQVKNTSSKKHNLISLQRCLVVLSREYLLLTDE